MAGGVNILKEWPEAVRMIRMDMLARPPPHRLLPKRDPRFYRPLPIQVEPAALTYEPSKRLKHLSQVPQHKFTEKYRPQDPPEHFVQPYCLTYVPTARIEEIARPKPIFKRKPTKRREKKHRSTRVERGGGKGKQSVKKPEKGEELRQWLELRAKPREPPTPPPLPKWVRKTQPLSEEERIQRIAEMAVPSKRYLEKADPWDPYQVPRRALRAKITERIRKLAEHRPLKDEARLDLEFQPFTIKRSALRCKASKRVKELAEPVVKKKKVENDVREDAFTVPKRALKAKCSKRIKELAKPIQRKGLD